MNSAAIALMTERLIIRTPTKEDGHELKAFEERNKVRLSPWRSSSPEIDIQTLMAKWTEEFVENKSVRFLLFLREQPEGIIIGTCNFSQIFRGAFQACYLGYQIDPAFEGKGLMSEAVKSAIQYMFEQQNIHRIMANYIPSNTRSARLLRRLNFIVEGQAKKYVLINGEWEDHILTSLTNPKWISR